MTLSTQTFHATLGNDHVLLWIWGLQRPCPCGSSRVPGLSLWRWATTACTGLSWEHQEGGWSWWAGWWPARQGHWITSGWTHSTSFDNWGMAWSVGGKKKNNRMAGQKSSGETLKSCSVSPTGTKSPFVLAALTSGTDGHWAGHWTCLLRINHRPNGMENFPYNAGVFWMGKEEGIVWSHPKGKISPWSSVLELQKRI